MTTKSSNVTTEDATPEDPKTGEVKPDDATTGKDQDKTPPGEKTQNPADAPRKSDPQALYCYDPDDPTTNIVAAYHSGTSRQDPFKPVDDERFETPRPDEQGDLLELSDLTKEFPADLPDEQGIAQELTAEPIHKLREGRFLVLYSKNWSLMDDIGRALAARWSGSSQKRYYIPNEDTRSAEPFSLKIIVERLTVTEPTLLIVWDKSQISFSPLVSRAYIGPDADKFLAQLEQRNVHMLVLSKYDTVEHVRKSEDASRLTKYFSLVESPEQEKAEAAILPGHLHEEAIFSAWCAAFFPDLSVDDILSIVNRMIDHSLTESETARKAKERLRKNWSAICAKCGLAVAVDATGITRLNFEPPRSASAAQEYFRIRSRPDHIYALQVFLECGIMMDLGGRSLQVAAASIAALANADPSALGENLLLRSAVASRSHPDIAQWWESDDFDSQPVLLLNILQAEFVSLVRLGHCQLASKSVKELTKISPALAIGLLTRCPAAYIEESWYVDAYVDVLRRISAPKVRLKSLRRLIRIAVNKKFEAQDISGSQNFARLAQLTTRIHESATQLVFADYYSCFLDTALLGQEEQRKAIHELLRSSSSSEAIAKILASPLKLEILWTSLSGWSWNAAPSKIDLWIRQRLLAEGPSAEVFAAVAPIFGEMLDDALAIMQRRSTPLGIVLGLLLLDHGLCISYGKSTSTSLCEIPVTLRAVLSDVTAFRDTITALGELSRRFAACSSLVGPVALKAGSRDLDAFGKIRAYLNRQSGMAISIRKSIEKETRN